MFLRASKVDAEAAGESTEGMANSVSELHKQLLQLTGGRVDILTDSGQYKSTYEILKDISLVWDDIVANQGTDSAAILELIGGKRNANAVAAILENFDIAEEAMLASVGSAGSAMEENAKVVESVQGHINQLKTAFEELSLTLVDSELIKGVVDFGRGLLETITSIVKFIEQADALRVMLVILAAAFSSFTVFNLFVAGMKRVIASIKNVIMIIPKAVTAWKNYAIGTATASEVMQASIPVIGLVLAAITALITGLTMYSYSIEETRQKHIDAGQAAKDEADNIAELIAQYKELAEADTTDEVSRTRIQSIQEQINKLVGDQADNLDLVNGKLDEEIKKLDEIALKTAQGNVAKLLNAKNSAEEALMAAAKGPMGTTETINSGFHESDAEEAAVIQALKDLGMEKYGVQNFIQFGQFTRDTSSIEALLQSYEDMEKLQNHIATNYKDMIGKGGALEDFYNNLTAEINEMEDAVNNYKNAISNWHYNEATIELGQYLKTNDIDSKEAFDNYISGIENSTTYSEAYKAVLIDLAQNTFPQFAEAENKVAESTDTATDAVKDFKSVLAGAQSLEKGLGQLDKIYADIYNKEAFDFSSILNNEDFAAAFGGLGDVYDDFIKTVANSPDDINACQDAFNKLSTAYIVNSGALKDVTDDTRNATIAMLEQKGIANATAIVDEQLAKNKELVRLQTELGIETRLNDIWALQCEAEASKDTAQALLELAIVKIQTNSSEIITSGDIAQLEALAESAGASAEYLLNVARAKAFLSGAEGIDRQIAKNPGAIGVAALSAQSQLLRAQAEALIKKPVTYDVEFRYAGSSNQSSGGGSPSEENWFERQLKDHQHLVAMEQETQAEYLAWLSEAYPKAYQEGIIGLDDFYKYQQEVFNGLRDLFRDNLADIEHEISMRGNYDGEAKKIIELYEGLIEKVEKEIEEARARGLTDEDDYIQELQSKWQDYTSSIKNLQDEITDAAKDALDELIDYRVDMLKQEIEDEKDALDERLDNLKEFYDKQKEMLQDQRDEENYLKDQSDKRKTVTDLQAELAMLANDDSAWAQKRKLELQEEIATAQEDLDEFEKDHALDLALDALDKAYNDQEAQIQAEMEALEERLNDPEALYNKALEDIRKNSENQLYYQMLMYNRQYGDGNDETVKDLWESAFGALSDYEKLFGELYKGVDLENETGVEDEGGWDDETISGTNPDNQQPTPPPPADDAAKEETTTPQLTDDIKKKVAAAIWNGGYGWGTGSTRTSRLTEVFGANNGIQALVNKGVGKSGVSLTNEYTYANMRKKFKGYASGTANATPGWHELFEGGLDEYIFTSSDGSRYRMFSGLGDKVLNGDATDFLYDFANSGGTVLTKMLTDLFKVGGFGNIAKPVQAIDIRQGDVIVQGNADMKTVSEIRRAQRDSLEFMLKELNRLNK